MTWEYTVGLLCWLSSYVALQWATVIQCNFRGFSVFEIIFFCLLISKNPPIFLTYWSDKLFTSNSKAHICLYLQKIVLSQLRNPFSVCICVLLRQWETYALGKWYRELCHQCIWYYGEFYEVFRVHDCVGDFEQSMYLNTVYGFVWYSNIHAKKGMAF